MQERADWLQGLGVRDIGKAVRFFPGVLERRIDTMQKVVDWLHGIGIMDVYKVVGRYPQVFAHGLEGVQSKADVLIRLGVKNPGSIIEKVPATLGCSTERLEGTISMLREKGIKDVARFVYVFPSVFSFSGESLEKKFELLYSYGVTLEYIEKNPLMLGYSAIRINKRLGRFVGEEGRALLGQRFSSAIRVPDATFAKRFSSINPTKTMQVVKGEATDVLRDLQRAGDAGEVKAEKVRL